MWKLVKMDFYRLFSSKTVKIGALMAVLLSGVYLLFSFGVVELVKFSLKDDPELATDLGTLLSQAGWVAGVDYADIVLSGTGFFALFIGCMISASFIGSEQSCGYTKNFAGQIPDKGYMAISKFIVTSCTQVMILVIYTGVVAAFAKLIFGQYITGYAIGGLFAALGLRVLLHLAMNAIIIFLCTLTRSHSIAMIAGCIFGLGVNKFAYMAASMLLSALKIKLNLLEYMPDGVNSMLSVNAVGDIYVKAIIVSIAFTAVFMVGNYLIVRNRDVR